LRASSTESSHTRYNNYHHGIAGSTAIVAGLPPAALISLPILFAAGMRVEHPRRRVPLGKQATVVAAGRSDRIPPASDIGC
jgi:hypothetical protein